MYMAPAGIASYALLSTAGSAHPISDAKQRRMVRQAGATLPENSPVNKACAGIAQL